MENAINQLHIPINTSEYLHIKNMLDTSLKPRFKSIEDLLQQLAYEMAKTVQSPSIFLKIQLNHIIQNMYGEMLSETRNQFNGYHFEESFKKSLAKSYKSPFNQDEELLFTKGASLYGMRFDSRITLELNEYTIKLLIQYVDFHKAQLIDIFSLYVHMLSKHATTTNCFSFNQFWGVDEFIYSLSANPNDTNEYWRIGERLYENTSIIANKNNSTEDRLQAANRIHAELDKCVNDNQLNDLTPIYRYSYPTGSVNLGYDSHAVSRFIDAFRDKYPKPKNKSY